jgi:hypothetical protein
MREGSGGCLLSWQMLHMCVLASGLSEGRYEVDRTSGAQRRHRGVTGVWSDTRGGTESVWVCTCVALDRQGLVMSDGACGTRCCTKSVSEGSILRV